MDYNEIYEIFKSDIKQNQKEQLIKNKDNSNKDKLNNNNNNIQINANNENKDKKPIIKKSIYKKQTKNKNEIIKISIEKFFSISIDPNFKFNIETVKPDELEYYINHHIKLDCSKFSINDERYLISRLNQIYEDSEDANIFNKIQLLIYKYSRSPEEIYEEKIKKYKKPIIIEYESENKKEQDYFSKFSENKKKKVFRRVCRPFNDLSEEDKKYYIEESKKERYQHHINNIIILKYLCLNFLLDKKKIIAKSKYFQNNYILKNLKSIDDLSKLENQALEIYDKINDDNVNEYENLYFTNQIIINILILYRESTTNECEEIIKDYFNDLFTFNYLENKDALQKQMDDYFYDDIIKFNKNITKEKSIDIFCNCLTKDLLCKYIFRYKRKFLITSYKNWKYDLKLYQKIAHDNELKYKNFHDYFKIGDNKEESKINKSILDSKEHTGENTEINHKTKPKEIKLKENKSKKNKPKETKTKGIFENNVNDKFNKEISIKNDELVINDKKLDEMERDKWERTIKFNKIIKEENKFIENSGNYNNK